MVPQAPSQYTSILGATPTVPKFYWDVKSQEQRIKIMCFLIQGLIDNYASTDGQIAKNAANVTELQKRFDDFVEHGFDEYYEQQVIEWISQHIGVLYEQLASQAFFGLTPDGHFCAYVPDSWSEITFDTGAVYGTQEYGRLILRFDADGSGVIDNARHDASVPADTMAHGRAKPTHEMRNDTTSATAPSPEAACKFAEPSK